jgi:hypothetical protein
LESEDCDENTLYRQQIQTTSKGFAALLRYSHSETRRGGEERMDGEGEGEGRRNGTVCSIMAK